MAEIRPVPEYPMLPKPAGGSPAALAQQQGVMVATLTRVFGEYGFAVNRLISRIRFGALADRPAAGEADRFWFTTDTDDNALYYDDGSQWLLIAKAHSQDLSFTANVDMPGLPTADPAVAGRLWNDAGTVKVSAG